MRIEERMKQAWGTTDNPELAIYLSPDGTLINGSYNGNQRDRDHRDVNEFFKPSKFTDIDIYIQKIMYRGSARIMCSNFGYWIELAKTPTKEQLEQMYRMYMHAITKGIDFGIGIRKRPDFWKPCHVYSFDEYVEHLIRHHAKAVS